MFNLFKKEKIYKKNKMTISSYRNPTFSIKSTDRILKMGDIITKRMGDIVEVNDNGLVDYIYCPEENENDVVNARSGYALNIGSKIFFLDSILNCLSKYITTLNNDFNNYMSFEVVQVPKILGITTFSNIEAPLFLEFLQRESYPIIIGDEIASNHEYLFGYKGHRYLNVYLPYISYGTFYMLDNIVKYHISEQLLEVNTYEFDVARVDRVNSKVINTWDGTTDGMFLYKDDMRCYGTYKEFLYKTKSIRRDKKLEILLNDK